MAKSDENEFALIPYAKALHSVCSSISSSLADFLSVVWRCKPIRSRLKARKHTASIARALWTAVSGGACVIYRMINSQEPVIDHPS